MVIKIKDFALVVVISSLIFSMIGCMGGTGNTPKQAVIEMFGAMEKDDKAALAHLLDLEELMKITSDDYALQTDKPRMFTSPQQILEDLTENGKTKIRWFSYQRIINKEEITGESAKVEVTFVDNEKSQAYLVKFGVHIKNGKWKIYSFNTIQDTNNANY